MKKVLVLGGNGFIGKNLVKYLYDRDMEVYSFDKSLPLNKIEGINYIEGDFFDDFSLENVVLDKDIVFHAISTVNPGNSNEKCLMGYERDFVQTVKLCKMIEGRKTQRIFLSSGGTVYGNQGVQPITEEAIPVPINHYGNIKLCIENTIRTFNIQSETDFLIARISNPYGPGQDYSKGVGFVDAAIKHAIAEENIEIWGDGTVVRDYIYIDDVCNFLYDLINYSGSTDIFNISSGVGTSINEIINYLRDFIPDIKVVYKPGRKVDVKESVLDNSRVLDVFPHKLVKMNDGIKMYYEYLKNNL